MNCSVSHFTHVESNVGEIGFRPKKGDPYGHTVTECQHGLENLPEDQGLPGKEADLAMDMIRCHPEVQGTWVYEAHGPALEAPCALCTALTSLAAWAPSFLPLPVPRTPPLALCRSICTFLVPVQPLLMQPVPALSVCAHSCGS